MSSIVFSYMYASLSWYGVSLIQESLLEPRVLPASASFLYPLVLKPCFVPPTNMTQSIHA